MCQRPEVKERETERERQDGGPEWREIQGGWSINGGRPTNTEGQQVAWGVHGLPLLPPVSPDREGDSHSSYFWSALPFVKCSHARVLSVLVMTRCRAGTVNTGEDRGSAMSSD